MVTQEYLDNNIEKSLVSNCWIWKGPTNGHGYGQIKSRIQAHRYIWELHNGKIEGGKLILHKCDVTLCVNPEHLYIGTQRDNMRDASKRNRFPNYHIMTKEKSSLCINGHKRIWKNLYSSGACRLCRHDRFKEFGK